MEHVKELAEIDLSLAKAAVWSFTIIMTALIAGVFGMMMYMIKKYDE